jgi:chromosome partitioning protein
MATVAVIGWKGGVGKSAVAVALALRALEDGLRVAVVDCDPQRSSARWLEAAAPELPVVQVEQDPTDPAGAVLRAVTAAEELADLVICDPPPSAAEVLRALALAADVALVPTGASVEEVALAGRSLEVLESVARFRGGAARPLVVLTRIDTRTGLGREAQETAATLGAPVASTALRYRVAWLEAVAAGCTLRALGSQGTEAAKEVDALWSEVVELLEVTR